MKDFLDEKAFLDTLDELCYRLKVCRNKTEQMKDFEERLKEYLCKWNLDLDQHDFVIMPK